MKKILFLFIVLFLNNFLIAQEYTIFYHKALRIELQYPNYWKTHSFPDKYIDFDYNSLSFEELHDMLRLSAISPILFIKKYEEIYYGVNPSIRINAYRIPYYLYNEFSIDIIIDFYLPYKSADFFINETIYIDNVEVNYRKILDYAIYEDINYDERFERCTEYFILKRCEDKFIIIFEITYGKNNIIAQEEIQRIINTIRIIKD